MDLKDLTAAMGAGEAWTEERHASFLNRLEDTFVLGLLGLSDADYDRCVRPRLDRRIPDSATESTRDVTAPAVAHGAAFRPRRRDREFEGQTRDAKNWSNKRARSRARSRTPEQCDVGQDQVVPQIGNTGTEAKTSPVAPPKQRKRRSSPSITG